MREKTWSVVGRVGAECIVIENGCDQNSITTECHYSWFKISGSFLIFVLGV